MMLNIPKNPTETSFAEGKILQSRGIQESEGTSAPNTTPSTTPSTPSNPQ